jgi:hypothetical protein
VTLLFILLALCGWGGPEMAREVASCLVCAPLAVLVLSFAPLVAVWMHDPHGHNLWGLAFVPVGLLLFLYSAAVLVMRWLLLFLYSAAVLVMRWRLAQQ